MSYGSKSSSEKSHPLSVMFFDPGSTPDSPDWGTRKAGGSYLQVPTTGYGLDCDPGLSKSKGCAILMDFLYPFEITVFSLFMEISTAGK